MGAEDAVDYGPLTGLIGTWKGDKGMDISPEPGGTEENPYFETIAFEAAGDVKNAEEQTLAIVRYHQVVTRKSNEMTGKTSASSSRTLITPTPRLILRLSLNR